MKTIFKLTEDLQNIDNMIDIYVEQKILIIRFLNTHQNAYWNKEHIQEAKFRLNQIERLFKYLLKKQAEIMQTIQQQTINQILE